MVNRDPRRNLIDYFKKNLTKGYTAESLKWALINQGYSRSVVEHGLEEVHKELAEKAPEIKEKPKIIHEIIDEYGKSITIKKPFWKRILGR